MPTRTDSLPDALNAALSYHLDKLRERIVRRTTEIARDSPTTVMERLEQANSEKIEIELPHLMSAIKETEGGPNPGIASQGIVNQIIEGLKSFTSVLAILAIIFAILGLFAQSGKASPNLKDQSQAFLDVAKIFAGAIVGSTGATVTSRIRRRER